MHIPKAVCDATPPPFILIGASVIARAELSLKAPHQQQGLTKLAGQLLVQRL